MLVRDAIETDMPSVTAIYNDLIDSTTVAWSEDLHTLDERRTWFERQRQDGFPVLVAVVDEQVAGFAAYGSFRGSGKWPGYRYTVEHTIHVTRASWGSGIGRLLLEELIDRARSAGLHVMVGAIDGDNDGSIAFHERLGFTQVGRMPEVGQKFGRWLDLVLMQKILD